MRTKSLVWIYCVSVFMVMLFPGFSGSEGNASEENNYQGLWVGEVTLDQVSKLSSNEPEKEMEQTADTISMRVILHIDTENTTYLLSHVVLAQSAGAEEEILFTDEEELSKWIENQKGKKFSARRIETVSYDLPRKKVPPEEPPGIEVNEGEDLNGPKVSDNLRNALQKAGIELSGDATISKKGDDEWIIPDKENQQECSIKKEEEKLYVYLKLKEEYELAHPLEVSKNIVKTGTQKGNGESDFVIDPWHRSNPFRHAYHDKHREGYRIIRDIQFEFDDASSEARKSQTNYGVEVLTGKYQEKIKGLVKEEITISGRFILHRISSVGKLNE